MDEGRQRLVLGLVSAGLMLIMVVGFAGRAVMDAEWWQVDHRFTAVPAVPLADIGPSPGPLMPTWSRSTPIRRGRLPAHDRVAYGLVHGQVVTVSGHGLDVRDARTGEQRWSYRRSGWTLLGWAVTGGRLVAHLEREGHREDRVTVGFDAPTGRLLWRVEGAIPAAPARATLRWPAGSGVVLTTDAARRTLYGRATVTGRVLWTTALPAGCTLSESAAHPSGSGEDLAVVTLACTDAPGTKARLRLLALDPGSGRTRWERDLRSSGPGEIAVRGSVTLVSDDTSLYAYARDGRVLMAREGEDICGEGLCPAAVSGDDLVVVRDRGRRVEAVQISTGRLRWEHAAPGYQALATAGGRFYGLRAKLDGPLLPAAVDSLDPADGRATTAATTELVVNPGLDGVRPWLEAAGGLLFVAAPEASPRPGGGARLTALHGGPAGRGVAELGGTAADDWPDACALLRRADLDAAGLHGYVARPVHAEAGPVRLPHPVSCTYEPDERASDPRELTVSVKWVATDATSASGLLGALSATQSQVRRRGDLGGDEAYELGPTAGTIAVRVDRYLIGVYASQPAGAATRLARTAAANLRAGLF